MEHVANALPSICCMFLSTHFKDKETEARRGSPSRLKSQACAAPESWKGERGTEERLGAQGACERAVPVSSCPSCAA